MYINVDVLDTKTLINAREHPDQYQNLAVRVSGWNSRFVTLSKEWQDMIIQRTQQEFRNHCRTDIRWAAFLHARRAWYPLLVFLKGCAMTCPWCHNPEGRDYRPN